MNYESIAEGISLLQAMGILKDKKNKDSKFSSEFISISKENDYPKAYDSAIRNLDYDILLTDDSFFQFEDRKERFEGKQISILRFAFFENPYDTQSYEDYLADNDIDSNEAGDIFREEYEQTMAEASLKLEFFPVRYDCSSSTYRSGIHPYSHFHFGFRESISIPLDKVISPLAFIFFILKTRYYHRWKLEMEKGHTFSEKYRSEKKSLEKVGVSFFSDLDNLDLFLT